MDVLYNVSAMALESTVAFLHIIVWGGQWGGASFAGVATPESKSIIY
jgi:hypothetical protein